MEQVETRSVFQSQFGFSESAYTLVFATNASCMIASTLLFRRLVRHHDEDRLLSTGLGVAALGSIGVLTAALLGAGPGPVWACLAVVRRASHPFECKEDFSAIGGKLEGIGEQVVPDFF